MSPILIFVNLKRFDVPRTLGGVCPTDDPAEWISSVMQRSVELGLGSRPDTHVVYLLPEALIIPAATALAEFDDGQHAGLEFGSQGVYRHDVSVGGNFGAFTTNLPAAASANLGCTWAIIGHSEERRDKLGVIEEYDAGAADDPEAHAAVDRLIGAEVRSALDAGLNALVCIGETERQRQNVMEVLEQQLIRALGDSAGAVADGRVVIGYEPVWAIGPGKTPPSAAEIGRIAAGVKEMAVGALGATPPVVYGGGLKEDNARAIGAQQAVNGGLVALTRFEGEIGFEPDGLASTIECYRQGLASILYSRMR